MNKRGPGRARHKQEGVALVISIFILLLISVVAIALIVSSGTDSAIAGNYRSSTSVYYSAFAGLEEVRERLLSSNSNSFYNTEPAFITSPLPVGAPVYIINPGPGEVVVPWDPSPANTYADREFNSEFNPDFSLPTSPSPNRLSVWNKTPLNALGVPAPLYKWVRINAISEKALRMPFDGKPNDATDPVYYDYNSGKLLTTPTATSRQVLEVTSFALLPNGSQKLLQYLVAPSPVKLPPLLAALTLSGSPGNSAGYSSPSSNALFWVQGLDQDCNGIATGQKYAAIGVLNSADVSSIKNGGGTYTGIQPMSTQSQYTGLGAAPDVDPPGGNFPFPPSLQTPSQLDAIAQTIIQNADAVVPAGSSATQTSFLTSLGMSSSNMLTVVAKGDLDISNWNHDGFGLLLVTGTFTYDPGTTWNGVILVIGQGNITGSNPQNKQINGAVFVAKTRDGGGNLLPDPNLGGASVAFAPGMQGYGIRYSNCWIQKAQTMGSYKVLSFHEISQ